MCAAICRAIQTRTLLAFDYDGHHRIIEPYCHGTGTVGQERLRAYQVAGDSSTGRSRLEALRRQPHHGDAGYQRALHSTA